MEVCLSQRWGTVTDDGWSTADAQVVCKLLGYSSQGVIFVLILNSYKYIILENEVVVSKLNFTLFSKEILLSTMENSIDNTQSCLFSSQTLFLVT